MTQKGNKNEPLSNLCWNMDQFKLPFYTWIKWYHSRMLAHLIYFDSNFGIFENSLEYLKLKILVKWWTKENCVINIQNMVIITNVILVHSYSGWIFF